MTSDLLPLTVSLTNDSPLLSSERSPHIDRTVNVEQELTFGHESQTGLDTKSD
jgi:hypothetical protein